MALRDLITLGLGPTTGGGGSAPATPVLTVTDNGNGTGGVATVTGSTAGTTNTVYSQPNGSTTWTSRGNRTGDGTISMSITTTGRYFFVVLSVNANGTVASNVVDLYITDTTTSVHYRCLVAVQEAIQGLDLTGIADAQIYRMNLPTDRNTQATITLPCVIVSQPGQELELEGTNLRDDIGYPVLITFVDKNNQNTTANQARDLLWRQRVYRLFRHQRTITSVTEIERCEVEPGPIIDPGLFQQQNLWIGSLVVRCISREVRG